MVGILITGACGKMGNAIKTAVSKRDDCKIVAGVDLIGENDDFPIFRSFSEVNADVDVIIDFSNPSLLDDLLEYACKNNVPAVICTTGFSKEQVEQIKETSKIIPIFYSGNMSLGINLMIELSKRAAAVLGDDFDIEIIEKHHNQKIDAPSGTALMIADGISSVMEYEPNYVYDRHSVRRKRDKKEIGIHAIRGGNIVGEHEVIFAGHDEIVTISHSARSKEVFAVGAINASVFMVGKKPKIYNMGDLLADR